GCVEGRVVPQAFQARAVPRLVVRHEAWSQRLVQCFDCSPESSRCVGVSAARRDGGEACEGIDDQATGNLRPRALEAATELPGRRVETPLAIEIAPSACSGKMKPSAWSGESNRRDAE